MFPTRAHRSISTFDCGALQSVKTLSVSHTHTHTHRFWYVHVDNFSPLYKNTNLPLPLTSVVQRPYVVLRLAIHDNSTGIETTPLQAGCPRNSCSIPDGGGETFIRIFSEKSSSTVEPAMPVISWVTGTVSPGVRRPRRVADHSLHLVTGLRMSVVINTFAASYLNNQGLNNSCLKSPASTLVDLTFQSRALRSFSLNQLSNLSL